MRERLRVRPELAVFEPLLRQRVERLSSIEEERFARPSAVERDASTGDLIVVAEFVTGSRLSELLDVSADSAAVPGVDAALGYLLESLPALNALHTSNRAVHGLIDASRTIVTAEGQVVFLDLAMGPAVEALNPTPQRLWTQFGISAPSGNERLRFDPAGDVTQVALCALTLVLGRNLQPGEDPDAIPTLLMEVIEVAHIRGTTAFAGGLQRILQRSLPLPGRRPYATANEMLEDVRQLVRKEIGLDVCRQAVTDFVAQMDAAFANAAPAVDRSAAPPRVDAASLQPRVPELDQFLDTFEVAEEVEAAEEADHETEHQAVGLVEESEALEEDTLAEETLEDDSSDSDAEETELSFEHMDTAPAPQPQGDEIYDLAGLDDLNDPSALSSELASFDVRPARAEAPPQRAKPVVYEPPPPVPSESDAGSIDDDAQSEAERAAEAAHDLDLEATTAAEEHAPADVPDVAAALDAEPAPAAPIEEAPVAAAPAEPSPPVVEPVENELEPEHESGSSRRRKRQQMKSARARKDKLRSTTANQKPPVPPPAPPAPPAPPKPASPSGWLVSPHRAAASESLIPEQTHVPVPQTTRPAQMPPVSFTPSPVGPLPQPTYANPSASTGGYGTPTVVKPPPPPVPPPVPPPPASLKIRAEPPPGFNASRRTYPESQAAPPPPDWFSTLSTRPGGCRTGTAPRLSVEAGCRCRGRRARRDCGRTIVSAGPDRGRGRTRRAGRHVGDVDATARLDPRAAKCRRDSGRQGTRHDSDAAGGHQGAPRSKADR